MITAHVGTGTGVDAFRTGASACTEVLRAFGSTRPDFLLVFGSVALDQDKLIQGILSVIPKIPLIGCSTAGEISSEGLAQEQSVVIAGVHIEDIRFELGSGHHILWNPRQAGDVLGESFKHFFSRHETHLLLPFLDVLSGNGDDVLSGLMHILGNSFPIAGSAAGDDLLFLRTYQYLNAGVHSGSSVALGLSGNFCFGMDIAQGFLPVGIERTVTKSSGTTIHEIDGKPAISLYQDYCGTEHVNELREEILGKLGVSYPIGVALGEEVPTLRNPIFIDQHGSITFSAAISEGARVRLMISSVENVMQSAEVAATNVLMQLRGRKPKLTMIFNAISRKKLLGNHAGDEIELIRNTIGREVPVIGMYGYGQIGGKKATYPLLHNGSALIVVLAE